MGLFLWSWGMMLKNFDFSKLVLTQEQLDTLVNNTCPNCEGKNIYTINTKDEGTGYVYSVTKCVDCEHYYCT
jgi:hypothetical protein